MFPLCYRVRFDNAGLIYSKIEDLRRFENDCSSTYQNSDEII